MVLSLASNINKLHPSSFSWLVVDRAVDVWLEKLKAFLGPNQKNKTPYEPLKGYYNIPGSTVKERGDELAEVMREFVIRIYAS